MLDSPQWLKDIGLSTAPDHNTLWRAFDAIVTPRRANRVIDLQVKQFLERRSLKLRQKPLTIDSTCFEQRHRSTHYDRRCRQMGGNSGTGPNCGGNSGTGPN